MKAVSAFCLSLFLFTFGAARVEAAPSLVYTSTFLGVIWDVAVDSAGSAYVLGYTGPPSYSYFVAKLSPSGELIFQHRLEELTFPDLFDPPHRYPSAIAVDPAGSIYIAGHATFAPEMGSEANLAFVVKLAPDGLGVIYDTFFFDRIENTQGLDLAVDALGQAYLHYTSGYDGLISVVGFSPAGSVSRWFGGRPYYIDAMALGPSGDLFAVGWAYTEEPDEFYIEVYLGRMDASSGAVLETLLARQPGFPRLDVAATPGDGSVVAGPESGGLYVAELGPTGEEIFSRVLNLGTVDLLDVVATSSGEIVAAVQTGSGTLVLRLEGGTGEVLSSMSLAYASAIAAGPGGDVYLASGGRVSRFSENRSPDCTGATASPSMIWPANGKMVPVSILGVTDPDGDPVTVEITGITQDEPGAAFSGIGSPTAQVKAERDGKGDGRVYRIELEAMDPSGASCTGEVTVSVPHDRGNR